MDSKFSGAVQLTDLNDFITPSQECIKPVQIKKSSERKGLSKIKISTDGNYMEVDSKTGKSTKLKKAEITLNDCLACSGCITSAESVLVAMQSHEEFFRFLKENAIGNKERKVVVVSISPQARASLAANHGLNSRDSALALDRYFKNLGCDIVLDTSYARELALLQSGKEFIDRFRNREKNSNSLPMLTSSCPGWICYAEKTHGKLIIPHLSTVKSPQQVTGTLVKETVSQLLNKTPDKCYHVAIMPCYDKKLEASRQDFIDTNYSVRDVDLVLAANEVQIMLEEESLSLQDFLNENFFATGSEYSSIEPFQQAYLNNEKLLNHSGGGSGGYLEYVFRISAKILFGKNVDNITYKCVRSNKDFREVSLTDESGKVLLCFAAAYGFRSIQNLVQKMKRGKCPYQFVEVMACPSGCLNGGGQIRSATNDRDEQKKILTKVEEIYNQVSFSSPDDNCKTVKVLNELRSDKELEKKYLHTQYHAVEKDESLSAMVKW